MRTIVIVKLPSIAPFSLCLVSAHTLHRLRAIFQSNDRTAGQKHPRNSDTKSSTSGLTWGHSSGLSGWSVKYLGQIRHISILVAPKISSCTAKLISISVVLHSNRCLLQKDDSVGHLLIYHSYYVLM